ncbi:MAG: shikimate kinase [Bacteroidales bacterium]|nr:shikimate kinase [Bacteroidales bacterium]
MRIYLIGYMGTGKSSMGKKLAARMDFSFIDLDRRIENEQKKTITQLFIEKGEDDFRFLERLALHQTFEIENAIIATGGGAPIFFDNMEMMNAKGLCIYLRANTDVLISRLLPNQHLRPLIASLNQAELQDFIEGQLEKRIPFYEKAQLHVESKDLTPAILHKEVVSWLQNQNNS